MYGVALLYDVQDAAVNGKWVKNNGIDYFYTDDTVGVSSGDKKRVGPCVFGLTGFNHHQGRIASVGYAVKHCVLPVDCNKYATSDFVLDIRRVHKEKLRLFATAITKWFEKCVWTDTDAANNYLRVVGELTYKIYDVCINVSKEQRISYCLSYYMLYIILYAQDASFCC